MKETITASSVLECLERSGYLLESRITRSLTEKGYFVEPNQVVQDPRTQKSREIDFVAEYYDGRPLGSVLVKTHFVGEVINNPYPFVLLTNRPGTPMERIESHLKYSATPLGQDFLGDMDLYGERAPPRDRLYSQYCALTRKKSGRSEQGDLMAHHPDDTYSSLQKLAEYVENELNEFEQIAEEELGNYRRLFFWHPMLVLGGDLFEITTSPDGRAEARAAQHGFLEFNWHQGEERRTTIVEVITESALFDRLDAITEYDYDLSLRLPDCKD